MQAREAPPLQVIEPLKITISDMTNKKEAIIASLRANNSIHIDHNVTAPLDHHVSMVQDKTIDYSGFAGRRKLDPLNKQLIPPLIAPMQKIKLDSSATNHQQAAPSVIGQPQIYIPLNEQINNQSRMAQTQSISNRTLSQALSIVFWLAVVAFFMQLFIMLTKYHFVVLLVTLSILGMFFHEQAFKSSTVRFIVVGLALSCLLDIFWYFTKFHNGYPGFYSQFATVSSKVHGLVIILVILSVALRVTMRRIQILLVVMLSRFWTVGPNDCYYISIMGNHIAIGQFGLNQSRSRFVW